MSKLYKHAQRCPMNKTSFDKVKSCNIFIVKKDSTSQRIQTASSFLQIDKKGESLETKIKTLVEHVCGVVGYHSYTHEII